MTPNLTARLDEIKKVIDAATPELVLFKTWDHWKRQEIARMPKELGDLSAELETFRLSVEKVVSCAAKAEKQNRALRVAAEALHCDFSVRCKRGSSEYRMCGVCDALKDIEDILCPAPEGEGG